LHIKRVAVGWNERLNRLYFMAEVSDNIHLFEKPADHIDSLDTYNSRRTGAFVHGSDIFEIVIDAITAVSGWSIFRRTRRRRCGCAALSRRITISTCRRSTVPIGTGCEDGRRGPMIRLIRMWAGVSTGSTVRMAR
jgi:hypothetical protein